MSSQETAVELESAWEIVALARLLRRESAASEIDPLIVRGIAARISEVGAILVQAIEDGDESGRLAGRLRGG